jgi:hypothetical protein
VGAVAEGLGIRAVARVLAVDPNTVLQWLREVADQAAAFSQYFLHDVQSTQVQLDELFALLSAAKAEKASAEEGLTRGSRSPQWVWVALDPVPKLLLAIEVGERTLTMAQGLVHQVTQVLASDCVPWCLTDGFKAYLTAGLTHYGPWVPRSRPWAKGPIPKPRWLPLPQLHYAAPTQHYCHRGQSSSNRLRCYRFFNHQPFVHVEAEDAIRGDMMVPEWCQTTEIVCSHPCFPGWFA